MDDKLPEPTSGDTPNPHQDPPPTTPAPETDPAPEAGEPPPGLPAILAKGAELANAGAELLVDHMDGYGLNDLIEVRASDMDEHGVPHRIEFDRHLTEEEIRSWAVAHHGEPVPTVVNCGFLQFQHGPRDVKGSRPGLISDALFAALIRIHRGFQSGPYASEHGAAILRGLEDAAAASKARAAERAKRGVLGQNKA